jgi:hypothetical protein
VVDVGARSLADAFEVAQLVLLQRLLPLPAIDSRVRARTRVFILLRQLPLLG